ncbi:MAG TPA: alpha-L-arabinofuranosidase C-terminal domain-containing protein, partial [Bacteroidales bacterium]|nr:alpha-L-arabinofuranosidase C-terminal domain-containing protein [Bacteroidales bacterium]
MKRNILLFAALFGLLNFASLRAQVKFEVDASQQGKAISQELIGAFFEDINYGADGGLYAELVQNRSFEYYPVSGYTSVSPLNSWYIIKNGGAAASMQVDNSTPLNSENTHYLKLTITDSGIGAGIRNTGFNGIAVKAGEKYNFSVYMKRETDLNQPVVVSLETPSGEEIGSDSILGISGTWQKYTLVLTAGQTENVASLNLVTKGTGNVYFDMVSLFPRNTFKNRKNGLRKDLATTIADLHPKFLRFPGGCVAHGASINNAYRWKETVGDVAERKPNWNLWGYHQTYGLGFYEYFQFCEDIGAKPLPVLWVGISCQFRNRQIVPMNEMDPVIQDAVDLIEFANGPADSQWGSVRASMGHPEPFNMEYLCLGNEEDDIPEFRERFTAIASAVKEQYPDIKIIGTSGTAASGGYYNSLWQFSREQNLYAVDEHYYMDPSWFLNNLHRYDNFDRNGPKVFIGEYASKDDRQHNAIAEASYLTGVEKNADVIQFTCYAPLLCNENNNQWNPDLIRFDNTHIVKTADYYVQQMYSVNAGDEYLASSITYNDGFTAASTDYSGKIGVGTWNTQAEFDDVKLVSGDQVLVDENYDSGASNWQVSSGTFITTGGVYSQTSG